MADPLAVVWERIDLPSPLIDGDEALRLRAGHLDRLVSAGLVRETQAAVSVVCDACDLGHVDDVVFVDTPADAGVRAYIRCPDNGRVQVPLDRLRQWEVDFNGMVRVLAAAIARDGMPEEIVQSRVWFIGKAVFAARSRDVFLARGLSWPDAQAVVAQASRLATSGTPLVLVAGAVPPVGVWNANVPPVLPVSAVLALRDGQIKFDRVHVESTLSGRGGKGAGLSQAERQRRIKNRQALFDDVTFEFATDPGVRHVVRINGYDIGGFRRSDVKFMRLLLLAAKRAADLDVEEGGWLEKWRLLGDEKDHDLRELRDDLQKHDHPDLNAEEMKALIKPSGRRDGGIRLAVHPGNVSFDASLANLEFVGEQQTKPKNGGRRRTPGTAEHEAQLRQGRKNAAKLLAEARKLGVPGAAAAARGRGE